MATLYKRANGPQQRVLAIVSGAVLNAADAIETAPAGFANWAKVVLREDFP